MSDLPDFVFPAPDGQEKDSCIPRFYTKPVQNNFKTQQEGRPIFDDVEYVEILIPGDRRTSVDERVKQEHKNRWPRFYQAFKAGQEVAADGWPLEEWSGVTRSMVEELRHFHVRTVEQLANLDDTGLQNAWPMGGYALRDKARRALEQAKGAAPSDALAAEVEASRGTMAVMQQTIEDLKAEVARLAAKNRDAAS